MSPGDCLDESTNQNFNPIINLLNPYNMNKLRTLKWTSLMMTAAMVIFSCGSDDEAEPKPNAAFTSAADADDYRVVSFTNSSENATSFEWNFGDGTDVSTEENPVHTFVGTGEFTVALKAKGASTESTTTKKVTITPVLSNKILNGNGSKSWTLKASGGSFIVGPSIGSGEWYPGNDDSGNPKNLSAERPCLFNDEFIFKTSNIYEYDANGDIWAEGYMGYNADTKDKCQDESTLPENAASWGSGAHTYSFTKATAADKAKITVTGTGAFIVLPKAINGAEVTSAPPATDGSITYDVVSYSVAGDVETMVITVNFGPGYWTYTLVHEN